jgi:hypothetical protein
MVSSTNKIDRPDIAEILLKVALNTIKQANKTRLLDIMDSYIELKFKLYNEDPEKLPTCCKSPTNFIT